MSSIKFVINGEVRRVPFPRDPTNAPLTFPALVRILQELVPTLREKKFTLTWLDDEGDVVTVATDYELKEAVDIMSRAGSVLKFNVVETPTISIPTEPPVLTAPFDGVIHHAVRCDECNVNPIVGIRYKCAVREDYDLCAKCEGKQKQPYPMLKIVDPAFAPTTLVYAFRDESEGNARAPGSRQTHPHQFDRPYHRNFGGRRGCPFSGPGPHGPSQGFSQGPQHHGPPHGCRNGPPFGPPFGRPSGSDSCGPNNSWTRNSETRPRCGPTDPKSKPGCTIERKAEEVMKELEKFNDKIVDWACPPSKFINAMDELIFGPARNESEAKKEDEAAKETVAQGPVDSKPAAETTSTRTTSTNNDDADDALLAAAIRESLELSQAIAEEEARQTAVHVPTIPAANGNLPKPALRFVKDVTFPDGTVVHAGAVFRKTWRVRNDGKHQWPQGSVLVTAGGDLLTSEDLKEPLPVVNPQEEVDISLQFSAPTAPGLYTAYFRAQTKEQQNFGHRLWASIVVAEPDEEGWDVVTQAVDVKSASAPANQESATTQEQSTEGSAEQVEHNVVSHESANSPSEEHVDTAEQSINNEQAQQQSFALLWRRELEILGDMGFADIDVIAPLLQTHVKSPVSLTAGAPNPEGMQRVIIELLNK